MGSLQTALQPEVTAPPEDATLQFQREIGKISRQSSVFFAGTLFTLVGGYLFKIYTARVLGAEGLGLYALGVSVVSFFSAFATLGIPRAMVRFVPSYLAKGRLDQVQALIWRGALIVCAASLVLGVLIVLTRNLIAVRIFDNPDLRSVLGLLAVTVPLGSVGFLLDQVITGFQKTALAKSIRSFFTFSLMVALTVVFFNLGWGVQGYIVAGMVSSGAGLILLTLIAWQLIPRDAQPFSLASRRLDKAVLSYAGSMIGLSILGFLSGEAGKVILGFHLAAASVGVYSVAAAVAGFMSILINSINPIFAPVIASLYAGAQCALLEQLYQTLTKWILALTLPLYGVVSLFAPEVMSVFGGGFEAGWPVLVVAATGQLLGVGVGSTGYLLMMSGHERLVVKSRVISSVATFVLYLLLTPALGVIGVAVAGGIGIAILNLFNLWYVRQVLELWPYNRRFLQLSFPVVLTAIALLLFRILILSSVGTSHVATILVAILLAYGVFLISVPVAGLDENDRLVIAAAWEWIKGQVLRSLRFK